MKRTLLALLLCLLPLAAHAQEDGGLELTILHTNDTHARHEPNADGDGGVARQATVTAAIRAERENLLLLDAGDRFTGSLFHQQYRGGDNVILMNALGYDAMTLGNHEFDDGDDALAAFIRGLNFPVLGANVDLSGVDGLADLVAPWVIIDMGGTQVGIIGMVTPETPQESRPSEAITFSDDLAGVTQAAVDALTAEGVNKIILLSHLGLYADEPLAEQVSGVDIIVGGHSHNLLSNLYASEFGEYPMHKLSASGEPVLIVHAGEDNEFIGRLDVTFAPDGIINFWGGDVIYLSRFIPPDPEIETLIANLNEPLEALRETIIGQTTTFIVGDRMLCRTAECSLGNVVADALRAETGAQIGFISAGQFERSIPSGDLPEDLNLESAYDIDLEDVLSALPYQSRVSTFQLAGADVQAALENSVAAVENEAPQFLQVSGLRFSWDGTQPAGSRVMGVEVQVDGDQYTPLDLAATYTLASIQYLRQGGDGYSMFAENATSVYDFGRVLDQVVAEYITSASPLSTLPESRITRLDPPPTEAAEGD
jgi:5'-nucleotidase